MTKNVLQICPSCAESNGAKWKNPRNTAPVYLGVCGCCKKVKPLTHIQFWQNIKSTSDLLPPEEIEASKKKKNQSGKPETNPSKLLGAGNGDEEK